MNFQFQPTWRKKRKLQSNDVNATYQEARSLFSQGKFFEATDLYNELANTIPDHRTAILAELYDNYQNIPETSHYFQYQGREIDFNIPTGAKVLAIGNKSAMFPFATDIVEITGNSSLAEKTDPAFIMQKNLNIHTCDIEHLPFNDHEFDFVYCSHILPYVQKPVQVCSELMRVGTKGYIETPLHTKQMWTQPGSGSNPIWKIEARENSLSFDEYTNREHKNLGNNILSAISQAPQTEREKALAIQLFLQAQQLNTMFLWEDHFKVEVCRHPKHGVLSTGSHAAQSTSAQSTSAQSTSAQSKPLETQIQLQRLGTEYGGWIIPQNRLSESSVCYCVGVGEDVSFDVAVAKEYGCTVHAFDPTPRAKTFVEKTIDNNDEKFIFHEVGLWDSEDTLTFHPPQDPTHVSHSIHNLQGTSDGGFQAQVQRLSKLMQDLGHQHIDLLKLDIEGAEYPVVDSILEDNLSISILCIEYHDLPEEPGARDTSIQKLINAGYHLVSREDNNYSFVR